MKLFPNTIDRNKQYYRDKHYRAHWQPMWAMIGLVLCTILMLSFGWAAIYDLCAKTKGVTKGDSIIDLATAYFGVFLDIFTSKLPSIFADFLTSLDYSSAYT